MATETVLSPSERIASLKAQAQAIVDAAAGDMTLFIPRLAEYNTLNEQVTLLTAKMGDNASIEARIEARVAMYAALSAWLNASAEVAAYRLVAPKAKSLTVTFGAGNEFAFTQVEGTRSGGAREQKHYTGKGLPEGARTKEVITLFGTKHGQVKAYPTKDNPYNVTSAGTVMSAKEITALLGKIVTAEKLQVVTSKKGEAVTA